MSTASHDQQSSRAEGLHLEIEAKLSQAKGICGLICQVGGNEPLAESASAAEALIEGVEKALDELRDIERGRAPREVQS
jgi:hypothetical protein